MSMSFQQQASGLAPDQVAIEQAAFMRKVYAFMAAGLLATGLTAMLVASSDEAIAFIVLNPPVFYGLLLGELAMVWTFAAVARKMSAIGAGVLFFVYAIM